MASKETTGASPKTRPQNLTRRAYLIMQTPTTSQIRTAIEVLKKFREHLNNNAANLVVQLPDTHFGDHCAARVEVMKIEQVSRIQTLTAQLESWRDQLVQERRQCVSHHV